MNPHENHFHGHLADEVPHGLRHREQVPAPADPEPTPPKVPSWVADVAKWGSLTRHERRALERHHRKQARGR